MHVKTSGTNHMQEKLREKKCQIDHLSQMNSVIMSLK